MGSTVFGAVVPHPPIFVPAVGGSRAQEASASLDALHTVRRALERFDPQVLVVISPHAPALTDAFVIDGSAELAGDLTQFGDRKTYRWAGEPELAEEIARRARKAGIRVMGRAANDRLRPGWLDHATIVPLSFIDPDATRRLVVLSLSYLGNEMHREFGRIVSDASAALNVRTAFIASGDLSHRLTPDAPAGYDPKGARLDAAIVGLVEQGRFSQLMGLAPDLVEAGGECGLRSIITLGGFCCDDPVVTRVLSYEGPWGVGYLTALVGSGALEAYDMDISAGGSKGGMPGSDASEIVALARRVIESHLGTDSAPHEVALVDTTLPARAGAFVSLHRDGLLRGCIGTILPVQATLAEEVAHNAIQAAMHDPRFPPLGPDELADLDIKVDVLHAPESCSIDELDPKHYGVIVSSGWRRGLLLPDLEGVDDVETQIRIAMHKADIDQGEHCAFERFRVDRYT